MIGQQTYDTMNEFSTSGTKTAPDSNHFNNGYATGEGYPKQHHNYFMNNFSKNGGKYQSVLTSLVAEMLNILTQGGLTYNESLSTQIFTALNNVFSNASNLASGTVALARIPATLTGKDADTLDNYHAQDFIDKLSILRMSNWESVVTSPFSGGILAMASGGGVVVAVSYSGTIARSIDGGRTWSSLISNPFGTNDITAIGFLNTSFILGTENGIIGRSTDYGLTWSIISGTPFNSSDSIQAIVTGNNVLIAVASTSGTSTKISRSLNYGVTWGSAIVNSLTGSAVDCAFGSNSFVILSVGSSKNYFAYSNDNGLTWTESGSNASSSYLHTLSYGNNMFLAIGTKTYRSLNLGVSWLDVTSPEEVIYDSCYINNYFIAVGEKGSTMYTSDGLYWSSKLRTGLSTSNILQSVISAEGNFIIGGYQQTVKSINYTL